MPRIAGQHDYKVRQRKRFWEVTDNGRVLAVFRREVKANAFKTELEGAPPAAQKWSIVNLGKNENIEINAWLRNGYEPYAVDKLRIYMKKRLV